MNKLKVKYLNDAKIEKAQSLFGADFVDRVNYEIVDNTIVLHTDSKPLKFKYTRTLNDVPGFELVKEIVTEVTGPGANFNMTWTQDHGMVWVVQRLVSTLISVPRIHKVESGMSAEDKAKFKEELARYKAMKAAAKA